VGLLTDFFIASPQEVGMIDLRNGPCKRFPTAQYKNADPSTLEALDTLVIGSQGEGAVDRTCELIRQEEESGPWLLRIRSRIVQALAALEARRLRHLAIQWGQCEEWSMTPEEAQDMVPMLMDLVALAIKARETGRAMYLWKSL